MPKAAKFMMQKMLCYYYVCTYVLMKQHGNIDTLPSMSVGTLSLVSVVINVNCHIVMSVNCHQCQLSLLSIVTLSLVSVDTLYLIPPGPEEANH